MADSENSRTLSLVTPRGLPLSASEWLTEQIVALSSEYGATALGGPNERVLSIWQDWMAAHKEVERLCQAQQRLERKLVAAVGFPGVEILTAGMERPVIAFSVDEIDTLLGTRPETVEVRREARAVLKTWQQAWDAMDERIGYSCTMRAEAEAEDRLENLAKTLWAEPSLSVAGIVAKLHAVLLGYEENGPRDEPPWPQIRSILMELTTIDSASFNQNHAVGERIANATE